MPGKIADPNVDIWYTDGLGISNRFGVGVYGPRNYHTESSPMGSLSTVFQVEAMAILRCKELLLPKNVRRRTHVCPDSRAAIAALAETTTESAMVWDSMQALEKLSGPNKATLVRLPH
jgi:hypothetical protein